ncbi:hypothetical protein BDY19DRAFT_994473 [Irpex rosettiformis]|uniref:Uncharacterized protein n=1 Tax=Irpex rosettiformis TaxID=378272 RepID=A0ACB8U1F1_9APHY|nr:hypothetical protein BDY19DRAFT_994473 [Irpex rosettiformis]
MAFRVIGNSAEDEQMMANAIRSVWGSHAAVMSSSGGYVPRRTQASYSDSDSENERLEDPHRPSEVDDLQTDAEKLIKEKRYDAALSKLQETVPLLVDPSFKIPRNDVVKWVVKNKEYQSNDISSNIALMRSCVGYATCYLRKGEYCKALEWLEEVDVIGANFQYILARQDFDWMEAVVNRSDYYRQRIMAYNVASDLFLELGNTGAAVHRKWNANTFAVSAPSFLNSRALRALVPRSDVTSLTRYRHPDPDVVAKQEVKCKELQVRGSWQKLPVPKASNIASRRGFASFVWNRRFYVLGGEKDVDGPFHRDFHYMDLDHIGEWHKLPSYPHSVLDVEEITGWLMGVHDDKAYMFTGSRRMDYFDLNTETWGEIKTSCEGSWKWEVSDWHEYGMEVVDGRMYIFGGIHRDCGLGCNLWIVLDISKRTWRKLSGDALPRKADRDIPGPRRLPVIWTDERNGVKKIWVMYGEADRVGARMGGEPHGGVSGYGYNDLWSWDIEKEAWQLERIMGNPPCPRSEMGYAFNEKLGKTIVFGGYSPTIPTQFSPKDEAFSFSYYGDTFIHDPTSNPPLWKHVITRGFPTYRAQTKIFCDPETGRTFLFGGYTNSDFVPDGKHIISRAFNDIWELRLDVEGGHFEEVDLEEEARTATVGPWRRCFNCGSAGPWKKCGGVCRGRVCFCDVDCQKEGWKEHKSMHKCRRRN